MSKERFRSSSRKKKKPPISISRSIVTFFTQEVTPNKIFYSAILPIDCFISRICFDYQTPSIANEEDVEPKVVATIRSSDGSLTQERYGMSEIAATKKQVEIRAGSVIELQIMNNVSYLKNLSLSYVIIERNA